MSKETFIKEKMKMGFSWFDALALWNNQNANNSTKNSTKDSTEYCFDMLEELYN